jgi:hypothetical protein
MGGRFPNEGKGLGEPTGLWRSAEKRLQIRRVESSEIEEMGGAIREPAWPKTGHPWNVGGSKRLTAAICRM